MRLATRVGWVTGLVGFAASFAVATHGVGMLRERPITPDLMLAFSPREAPPAARGDHPPVPRVVSAELPVWFGDASAVPARIAGRLVGAQPGTTVRLAIDVPDPGIWTGRDAAVAADGSFDFGPIRRGKYLIVASGGPLMSAPVATRHRARERRSPPAVPLSVPHVHRHAAEGGARALLGVACVACGGRRDRAGRAGDRDHRCRGDLSRLRDAAVGSADPRAFGAEPRRSLRIDVVSPHSGLGVTLPVTVGEPNNDVTITVPADISNCVDRDDD